MSLQYTFCLEVNYNRKWRYLEYSCQDRWKNISEWRRKLLLWKSFMKCKKWENWEKLEIEAPHSIPSHQILLNIISLNFLISNNLTLFLWMVYTWISCVHLYIGAGGRKRERKRKNVREESGISFKGTKRKIQWLTSLSNDWFNFFFSISCCLLRFFRAWSRRSLTSAFLKKDLHVSFGSIHRGRT